MFSRLVLTRITCHCHVCKSLIHFFGFPLGRSEFNHLKFPCRLLASFYKREMEVCLCAARLFASPALPNVSLWGMSVRSLGMFSFHPFYSA